MNKLNISKIYDNAGFDSKLDVETLKSKAASLAKFTPALLLAGVVPAEAQVVCNDSAAPIVVSGNFTTPATASIDMNGDGNADFYVSARTTTSFAMGGFIYGPGSNNVVGELSSGSFFYTAANLSAGFVVGPTLPAGFSSNGSGTLAYPANSWGNFIAPDNGFAGVSFDIAGATHYGWIELSTSGGGGLPPANANGVVTIEGFCYETTAGASIVTGERDTIVPTMGEWALISLNLLLMIFGVVAVRQRGRIAIKQRA